MLKLQFEDHFHNFGGNWQVGNESIVQIDCQVIRQVVRTGSNSSCFKLSRDSARCHQGSWLLQELVFDEFLRGHLGQGFPDCLQSLVPSTHGKDRQIDLLLQELGLSNLHCSVEMNWKNLASQEIKEYKSWFNIYSALKRSS